MSWLAEIVRSTNVLTKVTNCARAATSGFGRSAALMAALGSCCPASLGAADVRLLGRESRDAWENRVRWIPHRPVTRRSKGKDLYADILNHTREYESFKDSGLMADAHENAHGVNADLINKYSVGRLVAGFYVGENRSLVLDHPAIRIEHAHEFIPPALREYRFPVYMVEKEADWGDYPLYIYDEWVAYLLSARVGLELIKNGEYEDGPNDGVMGCLELAIYATAIAMATEQYDPEYFESNEQFRAFTAWMLRESFDTFLRGRRIRVFRFDRQDALYETLCTADEAKEMRDFLVRTYGRDWVRDNLGF